MTMKTPWWRSDSPAPVYPQDEAWAGSGSVSVESEGPGGPLVSGLACVPPSTCDVDGCTDVTDPCCTGGGVWTPTLDTFVNRIRFCSETVNKLPWAGLECQDV